MTPRRREPLTRPEARRRRRWRAAAALTVVVLGVGGTAYATWQFIEEQEFLLDERCEVTTADGTLQLSPTQAHNAATISAAAIGRELPPEAAVHVVAFSLQESDLSLRAPAESAAEAMTGAEESADDDGGGTEDGPDDTAVDDERAKRQDTSLEDLELFTRGGPSWDAGTAQNPTAITLGEVLTSVEDAWDADIPQDDAEAALDEDAWTPTLTAAEAAEVLQRPHDPSFYAEHASQARAFGWPLAGGQPLGMTCHLSQRDVPAGDPEGVLDELDSALPGIVTGTEGSSLPEPPDSADQPMSLELSVPERTESTDYAWLLAQWSVAAAEAYGIQHVDAAGFAWDRDSGTWARSESSAQEGGDSEGEDTEGEDGEGEGAEGDDTTERTTVTLTFREE